MNFKPLSFILKEFRLIEQDLAGKLARISRDKHVKSKVTTKTTD